MYRRILVIEDEAILRRVIVRNLTSRGATALRRDRRRKGWQWRWPSALICCCST
ncbi:MAG: hypothetical protein U0841_25760 [Chloroflexia bacterium]